MTGLARLLFMTPGMSHSLHYPAEKTQQRRIVTYFRADGELRVGAGGGLEQPCGIEKNDLGAVGMIVKIWTTSLDG